MFRKIFLIVLMLSALTISKQPTRTLMSRCDPETHDVIVKFISPDLNNLKQLGFKLVEKDTVRDTGSCVVYISNLNVYYITKRNAESVRYDAEIWKYTGHECIKRK